MHPDRQLARLVEDQIEVQLTRGVGGCGAGCRQQVYNDRRAILMEGAWGAPLLRAQHLCRIDGRGPHRGR